MSMAPLFRVGAPTQEGSAMTRKTINYERLGVEACEAYTEGPESFADFVSTILSVAARCMYFKPQSAPCQRNHSMRSRRCPRRDTDLALELAATTWLGTTV